MCSVGYKQLISNKTYNKSNDRLQHTCATYSAKHQDTLTTEFNAVLIAGFSGHMSVFTMNVMQNTPLITDHFTVHSITQKMSAHKILDYLACRLYVSNSDFQIISALHVNKHQYIKCAQFMTSVDIFQDIHETNWGFPHQKYTTTKSYYQVLNAFLQDLLPGKLCCHYVIFITTLSQCRLL